MRTPATEEVTVFNPKKDNIEVLRIRKLKSELLPKVLVEIVPRDIEGLDPDDKVRAPILRRLIDKSGELDPRTSCVKGNRSECDLYDRLVKVSNAFLQKTPKSERAQILTMPEAAFLHGEPRFCRFCLMEEHQRRKRANKSWRRLAKWLRRMR